MDSGERYPNIEDIEEIAVYFNTNIETLIFGNRHRTDYSIQPLIDIYNQLKPTHQKVVYSFAEKQLEEQQLENEFQGNENIAKLATDKKPL